MDTGNKLLVILLVGVALGEVHGSTNATTVEKHAQRCFQMHRNNQSCPDYKALESCVSGIQPITVIDKVAITDHQATIQMEKDFCPELDDGNTCANQQLEKCFVDYKVYLPSYDKRLCSEIKKVRACVSKINEACGYRHANEYFIRQVVDLHIFQEKERQCDWNDYDFCNPTRAKECLKWWHQDKECCDCTYYGTGSKCLWTVQNKCRTPEMQSLAKDLMNSMEDKCTLVIDLEKCFIDYKVYLPSYDSRLCSEIKKVRTCVEKVNQASGNRHTDQGLIAMVVDLDIFKEKERQCDWNDYEYCNPSYVKQCLNDWHENQECCYCTTKEMLKQHEDKECCDCSSYGTGTKCLWTLGNKCDTPDLQKLIKEQTDVRDAKCPYGKMDKCFVNYKVYLPSYDSRLCSEIKKVRACVEKLNQASGNRYTNDFWMRKSVDLNLFKEKERQCDWNDYEWCNPTYIKGCLNDWHKDNECCNCTSYGTGSKCLWTLGNKCNTPKLQNLVKEQRELQDAKCPT